MKIWLKLNPTEMSADNDASRGTSAGKRDITSKNHIPDFNMISGIYCRHSIAILLSDCR